ncbi:MULTISPECIES: ChaB family protein [Curtobacterium]|jgi:cation transport regulator ChaB|uniref:ChaB family protein n=2 Tax=Curtobacterium TaxID=2034 RepID=A0A9Q2W1E2_9MICO|nr:MULTISPECIES: ChaB family protein [Curtobacterium]KIQ12818.1 cation transport regulator ChaB [Curtobacterium flaccumfaciens]MBF4597592.1 ChaB family protein [Curtobacterium sp. VKM Ac-1796]MBF4612612.1 ChaB family protein [Curtobacterium sp. VKM Ac-2889]MBT1540625.1 ChaB family protein [Curtobacterium flaccumfaciens pv. flaccumfaciens]MBT1596132.1 ChaB family protein [Curtobacterium flaccumfaciens pv. flaccumfaciens]
MPAKDEIPSTLQRSPEHAQEIFEKALDSANESYGPGERAHRTAFAAVKHEYEKVGDHWEEKESSGPSDSGAAGSRGAGSDSSGKTEGGVDANASKAHLMDVAKRLDVRGRSKMNKDELVDAIGKANDRATAAARK